jgi:hypothetical protein
MDHALGHILTGLVMALLAFLFKPKVTLNSAIQMGRLRELTPQFLKADKIIAFSMIFVIWPFLTLFFAGILWIVNESINKIPSDALFYFSAFSKVSSFDTCVSIGLGLAIGFSIPVVNFIVENKFAQDFELYVLHTTQTHGINYVSFSKAWVRFFTIISLFFMGVIDDWYLKITKEAIEINRFMSFQKELYNYEEVEKITFSAFRKAPNGDIVAHNRYQILFRNGNSWVLDDWLKGEVTNDSLTKFLSQKTSLKIENQHISEW